MQNVFSMPAELEPLSELFEMIWDIEHNEIDDIFNIMHQCLENRLISDRVIIQVIDRVCNERPKQIRKLTDLFEKYFENKKIKITPNYFLVSDAFIAYIITKHDIRIPFPYLYFGKSLEDILNIHDEHSLDFIVFHDDIDRLIEVFNHGAKIDGLINNAARYGSPNCFKFLYLNNQRVDTKTLELCFIGCNIEIINILEQKFPVTQLCVENAAISHNNDVLMYLTSKYDFDYSWYSVSCSFNLNLFFEKLERVQDLNDLDFREENALINAARAGMIPVVDCLHKNGAEVNLKTAQTPLMAAVDCDNKEMMEFLIERGAEINVCDKGRISPLLIAAYNQSLDILKYLIDHGADLEIKDKDGNTTLMVCARFEKPESLKLLLEYGANINEIDSNGMTAFKMACRYDSKKCAAIIAEYMAKTNTNQ